MKHIIAIAVLSIFSVSAHAALPHVPHAPLCELSVDTEVSNLDQVGVIDVRTVASVSPEVLSYINQHLQHEEYTTADLDLVGIQAFFAKEEPYNEIYVTSYKVKSSGASFTEVRSYPGDNPYSLFFDVTGNIVAVATDGDVALKVGDETIYCWSAAE